MGEEMQEVKVERREREKKSDIALKEVSDLSKSRGIREKTCTAISDGDLDGELYLNVWL